MAKKKVKPPEPKKDKVKEKQLAWEQASKEVMDFIRRNKKSNLKKQ